MQWVLALFLGHIYKKEVLLWSCELGLFQLVLFKFLFCCARLNILWVIAYGPCSHVVLFSLKAVYKVKGVFLEWKLLRCWGCSLLCLFYYVIAIETIPEVNVQFNNEQFAYSLNLLCDIIKFSSLETIKYLNFWGLHQMIGLHDNGLAAVASDSIQCLWSSFRNWLI